MHELWGSSLPVGRTQNPLASETLGSSYTPVAAGLRPGKSRMFTPVTRMGEGKRGSRSKAPNFSTAPERERRAGALAGGSGEAGRAKSGPGDVGTAYTSPAGAREGREGSVRFGRCRRRPRTRRGRGQSPSPEPAGPQSRHRSRLRSRRLRGRQVLPTRTRVRPVGRAGSQHPLTPRGRGTGAVALTWLVRGGRDGHGSGARGVTGSPGKDRLVRRGAGESGRQAAHSPVSEAAPWTPTRSFSAVAGPPSHYPPPSSAAAAASSTSSSAETPRPLHTLSHHAAGEPLPPRRHFRAQVARSGPGAGGCRGGGGGHSRGISVTERLPLRRRGGAACRPPFWVWASCPFPLLPCESSSCCGEGRLSAFRLPLKLRSGRGTGAFQPINDIVQLGPS